MLTDDDLTRDLGDAFRSATADLNYAGRARPHRRIVVALPAATAVAALAAISIGMHASGGHTPATVPSATGHQTNAHQVNSGGGPAKNPVKTPTKTHLVTHKITLAGYTIRYQAAPGGPDPVLAEALDSLPSGVTPVKLDRPGAQGWTGKDTATGDNALYIKVAGSNSKIFALLSSTFTDQQLIAMFESPTPTSVPEVPAGSH